jgi:protein CMS1
VVTALPRLHTRLTQKPKRSGAPTLIFLSGAALRVADATRVLKDKRLRGDLTKGKAGDIAKLFAKHIRFEEHVSYLKRTSVAAAAGTPGRIGKLLMESGAYSSHFIISTSLDGGLDALSVSALTHIILDVTYTDVKKRSLLSIPETRDEVFKTVLGAPEVLKAMKDGKLQVVLF